MKSKRLISAVLGNAVRASISAGCVLGLCAWTNPAMADDVTAISNQDQANRLSIFHDYSISAMGTTAGNIPGTPGSGLLGPLLGSSDGSSSDRAWSFSGTPLFGYDSNPEAQANAPRGSAFAGVDANAVYAIRLDPNDLNFGGPTDLLFSYDVGGALYEGMDKQANVIQQTATGSLRHDFLNDTLIVRGVLQDQFTMEHGYAFLNSVDVVPSLEQFWLPQFSTQIEYDFARLNYFFHPTTLREGPSTFRDTITAYFHYYPTPQQGPVTAAADRLSEFLRQTLGCATFGVAHIWNTTGGDSNIGGDYDEEANRIIFGLQGIRPLRSQALSLDMEYAHEWDHFDNFSSFTAPVVSTPRAVPRRDHMDVITIRANARLADFSRDRGSLGAFLQWDVISDRSNVPVRDFNEFVVSAGVSYHY